MDLKQEGKEALEKADEGLTSLAEIVTRMGWTKWVVLGCIVLALLLLATIAFAGEHGGYPTINSGQSTTSNAVAGASSNAVAGAIAGATGIGGGGGAGGSSGPVTVGGASTSVRTQAYGGGSTGLTSTAPCLGSFGALFNLASGTYVEKGCVLRHYAQACKDDACRQQLLCLDPDLVPEAKAVLGCAK